MYLMIINYFSVKKLKYQMTNYAMYQLLFNVHVLLHLMNINS